MPSPNDRFEKLMWSFLVQSINSGKYGHKLFVLKKLRNGYILAIRAKNQRTVPYDELCREWRVFLDYQKLKGRPRPNTPPEFTAARSAFFNALLKCRCLSVDQGSFTLLKDFSEYGFHPEKNYKYYLFICKPNSMPNWPVNLIEEPISSDEEQQVPHSPNNILEQAIHEAEVQVTAYNVEERDFDESRSSSIDEVSMKTEPTTPTSVASSNWNEEFIDLRNIFLFPIENVAQNSTEIVQCNLPKDNFPYMENNEGNVNNANHDNAFSEVSHPVAHAAEQDPPGANAVALFTSQQVESGEVPSNPEDTLMDSPETPEYAFNEGNQICQNYTPESSPLRDPATCGPMRSDLMEKASVPFDSQSLVSGAPLEDYTQCDETQTPFDPDSFLNLNEISTNNNTNEELFRLLNEPPKSLPNDNDLGECPREFDEMDIENVFMNVPRG